jgi:hypothetical protein
MDFFSGLVPTGFSFDISALTKHEDLPDSFYFSVVGHGSKKASVTIKATVKRLPAIRFGIFGNVQVYAKENAHHYSYDSRLLTIPSPTDSTGICHVATNRNIFLGEGTFLDGDVKLGHDSAGRGVCTVFGTPIITGDEDMLAGRLARDPLAVDSEDFRMEFDTAAVFNDNDDIAPSMVGTKIVNPGGIATLSGKPGGSVYYLEEISLFSGDTLTINGTTGPVTLYVKGRFTTQSGARVNILSSGATHGVTVKITEDPVNPLSESQKIVDLNHDSGLNANGSPTGFSILTDSDGILLFHHDGCLNGLVYAPNAKVVLHNGDVVRGALLAKAVEGQDGAIFYFDTALVDQYPSDEIALAAWERQAN